MNIGDKVVITKGKWSHNIAIIKSIGKLDVLTIEKDGEEKIIERSALALVQVPVSVSNDSKQFVNPFKEG